LPFLYQIRAAVYFRATGGLGRPRPLAMGKTMVRIDATNALPYKPRQLRGAGPGLCFTRGASRFLIG
jgi:hypothetical protein